MAAARHRILHPPQFLSSHISGGIEEVHPRPPPLRSLKTTAVHELDISGGIEGVHPRPPPLSSLKTAAVHELGTPPMARDMHNTSTPPLPCDDPHPLRPPALPRPPSVIYEYAPARLAVGLCVFNVQLAR